MKEKFEPFKELLKALREIKCAIGCKNDGAGNGSDIVLPKYAFIEYKDDSDITFYKVFEIDYDGKLIDIMTSDHSDVPSEEQMINITQCIQNYTTNPAYNDYTKRVYDTAYLYTKEQIDTINKNSIIQTFDSYYTITKFNDSVVVVDLLDMLPVFNMMNIFPGLGEISNYAQREQYYCIVLKEWYDYSNDFQVYEAERVA